MAADREVLRSFLVSIGFQIDETGAKKFANALGFTSARSLAAAGAIGTVAVAIEEMARSYANSVTKMFYLSQQTRTPIAALRAVGYAAQQIGIANDEMLSTIRNVHAELRKNPGKQPLLAQLGISDKSLTSARSILEIVDRLNERYPYEAAFRVAENMFGIPEQMFFQITKNRDEFVRFIDKYEEKLKQSGSSSKEAEEDARKYEQALRDLGIEFDQFSRRVGSLAVPSLVTATQNLTRTAEMLGSSGGLEWLAKDRGRHLPGFIKEKVQGAFDWFIDVTGPTPIKLGEKVSGTKPIGPVSNAQAQAGGLLGVKPVDKAGLRVAADRTASEFGISKSVFAALIQKESAWDVKAQSPTGPKGLTQLARATAQDMEVRDVWDPVENMRGGARYLAGLFKQHGNMRDALAAYNMGPTGFKNASVSERDLVYRTYADPILRNAEAADRGRGAVTLNQQTTINVNGGNAESTGRVVADQQRTVNADLVRMYGNQGP